MFYNILWKIEILEPLFCFFTRAVLAFEVDCGKQKGLNQYKMQFVK